MNRNISKHVSPDGSLTPLVVSDGDDTTSGFEAYPWHTHADVLAGLYRMSQDAAVARFVDALLGDEAVVAIATVAGRVEDVWVSDDPSGPGFTSRPMRRSRSGSGRVRPKNHRRRRGRRA